MCGITRWSTEPDRSRCGLMRRPFEGRAAPPPTAGVRAGSSHRERAVVEQFAAGTSLSRLPAAGGRTPEVSGVGARAAGCLPGMVLGPASSAQSRPLHWLERRRAPSQPPLPRLQHAIFNLAVGQGGTLGVAYSGAHGVADLRGLAADLRTSDLLSGDVCGSGTIPRNLLSCGQLGGAGQDDGTW